jgi:putative membrane protein
MDMSILGAIVGIVIAALFSAVVIWIVGKLGLGLSVSGFGPAFVAGIVIAIVGGLVTWLLGALGITIGGGLLGAIIHLIIAALVLMFAGNMVKGLQVNGFGGALVAAIAIAVVAWLISWLLGLEPVMNFRAHEPSPERNS